MTTRILTGSIRVSSEEQKKSGQQVSIYKSDILRHGVLPNHIFEELAKSGSMDEDKDIEYNLKDGKLIIEFDLQRKRPAIYNWLTNYVLKGIVDTHFITKWDRLARNIPLGLGIINLCKKHHTQIIATNDTNDEKMVFFSLALAHIESMLTKDRMKFNKQFKFDNGLYLGTQNKLGYQKTKVVFDGREFVTLEPKESEIPIIKDIFKNHNYKEVCSTHNITPSVYFSIRKDKFYCGYIKFKGIEKKGIHTPLVTEQEWLAVQ